MRKLTLLTLLAAILCLPQWMMAKTDPVFGLNHYSSALSSMCIGRTYDANVVLYNHQNLPVTWSSSNTEYFTVDQDGIITPLKVNGDVPVYAYLRVHTDGDENYNSADDQIEVWIVNELVILRYTTAEVAVTPTNADDILGNGELSYNYATHTLTMNNWTVNCPTEYSISKSDIYDLFHYEGGELLTVNLVGTNTITDAKNLFDGTQDLTFTGSGSLTVNGETTINAAMGQLTIDGTSLTQNYATDDLSASQGYTAMAFWADKLAVINSGNFHVTVSTNVDLSLCGSCYSVGWVGTLTEGDILTEHVIWSADAANEANINDAYKDANYNGYFFDDQKGAMLPRELEIGIAAPVTPPSGPSGPSFTWSTRQINLVYLSCYNEGGKEQENGLINNIFTSLTQTRDKNEDYNDPGYESCQFSSGRIEISGCGDLKFKSIAGDLTGIIITGNIWTATDLPANWTYDDVAGTLTWVGTPDEEVTLSGNLSISVSSIEYFYSPAAAPRLGETFYDESGRILYQITGAQTVKIPSQINDSYGEDVPASVEDGGVTYYVTEIDDYAWYNKVHFTGANIGENVARIGAHAFDGCIRASEIHIYSGVLESIGDEAFKNCKLLQAVECYTDLPPMLGSDAFDGDNYLNHINVHSWVVPAYQAASSWSPYSSKITALFSAPAVGEQFFYVNQIYEVSATSPKQAKVLPYNAEVNAIYPITREGTLVIPEDVTYMSSGYAVTGIGANAYKDSTRFNMVLMPQAVKSIEAGAFLNCTGVEKVFFLWDDPNQVTWADANVGADFKTATSHGTQIFVPKGRLAAYQAWAPAWASCMYEGEVVDVTATADPWQTIYYRTFYDSSVDYMLPPSVSAFAGVIRDDNFILAHIASPGEIVPAGTAVVLQSFTQNYRLIPTGNTAPAYSGQNVLVGTDVDILRTSVGNNGENVYVLGREAWVGSDHLTGMGMYRYTGTTLGAHKAYLIYNGTGSGSSGQQNAPARFLFKQENQATGVENVQSDKAQCTKVIRNGQLILIKDGKEYNAQGLIIK